MENNNQLQKVISTTSLHFLEVMKHQSVEKTSNHTHTIETKTDPKTDTHLQNIKLQKQN